jgi:hypothetical protein
MLSIDVFTAFARRVSDLSLDPAASLPNRPAKVVAPVSAPFLAGDTGQATEIGAASQKLEKLVAPVSPVAPQNDASWDDGGWQAAYDERAGILEYDGGLTRAAAERLAQEEVFGRWAVER